MLISRTQDIQTALERYSEVELESVYYFVTESIVLTEGKSLKGSGDTYIFATGDFPAIIMKNKTSLKAVNVTHNISGDNQFLADGVRVDGSDVEIEDCKFHNCFNGVTLLEDVAKERIKIINCAYTHSATDASNSQWGFQLADVDDCQVIDCAASGAQLDGLKLRKNVTNVIVRGGTYFENVQNGIDTYAGGENVVLDGVVCRDNTGNGYVIKTGPLNPAFGDVRNYTLKGCIASGNGESGFDINRSDPVDVYDMPINILVTGCISRDNDSYGFHFRAESVTVVGCVAEGNGDVDFITAPQAEKVAISECIAKSTVPAANIVIGGTDIRVSNCEVGGTDYGVWGSVNGVRIFASNITGTADVALFIRETPGGGDTISDMVVNQRGTGVPAINCALGSVFWRLDGAAGTILYVKESSTGTTGWVATTSASGTGSFARLIATAGGSAGAPAVAIGDADSGLYEAADDFVVMSAAATAIQQWTGGESKFLGKAELGARLALTSIISPSLTGSVNDWTPTGITTANIIRVDSDAAYDITGLGGGFTGGFVLLQNISAFSLTLKHNSGSSSAGFKFFLPGAADKVLTTGMCVVLMYDATSLVWRIIG